MLIPHQDSLSAIIAQQLEEVEPHLLVKLDFIVFTILLLQVHLLADWMQLEALQTSILQALAVVVATSLASIAS